ncbi:AbrB/MazE/SpoVT family DNA-binding domain-containing protein [Carboxydothermus pertinax]|uniref:AbrB family transcriptional regulator n=1 Tax=Carboxydothermus pertinax TaxID=870242 RepID=A0A1L8CTP2_9THEO|nr:AbrB/MazE/SpoVT family DNA-binding domain-containing protein [Carboxydothermus pertinax]GAV22288.1 AbrB family transcriptional regulator [Carboxydothermus pertinax]
MAEVIVSSKHQIVLPAEIRKTLGIEKVQRLHVLVESGSIRLIPSRPLSEMRGFLRGMDTNIEREK